MNRRAIVLWAPAVVYMAAIFWVSSLPQPPVPVGGDKTWHLIAYAGLGVVVVRAVAGGLTRGMRLSHAAIALLTTVAYAASDEVHQMFVPGRSAELADVLADTLGAVAGIGVSWAGSVLAGRRLRDKAGI